MWVKDDTKAPIPSYHFLWVVVARKLVGTPQNHFQQPSNHLNVNQGWYHMIPIIWKYQRFFQIQNLEKIFQTRKKHQKLWSERTCVQLDLIQSLVEIPNAISRPPLLQNPNMTAQKGTIDFAVLPPQTASDTSVPACEAHLAHESSSAVRVTGEKHRQYIQRIDNIDTYRGETRKIPKAILNNLTTSSHLLYTSIYNTSIYFKRTGTKSYKITGHHSNRSRSF